MLDVVLIGKVISEPESVQTPKGSTVTECRLGVNLKENPVIKLSTFVKEHGLVKDEIVLVAGKLAYLGEDQQHLVLTANTIAKPDTSSPAIAFVTGGAKFNRSFDTKEGKKFHTFQLSSYDGLAKSYTRVSVKTNSGLAPYTEDKRTAAFGTLETDSYTSKKDNEKKHQIVLNARDLEITERKDGGGGNSNANKGFTSPTQQQQTVDYSQDIPF